MKKKNFRKEHILNNVERKPVVRAKDGLSLWIYSFRKPHGPDSPGAYASVCPQSPTPRD